MPIHLPESLSLIKYMLQIDIFWSKLKYSACFSFFFYRNKNVPYPLFFPDRPLFYLFPYNIIPLFQLSDVLCHTGYGFVIYDLVRNNEGNVIDVIIIEYGCGIGASYVSSKITRYIINTPSGEEFVSNLYSLFLSKK